VVFSMSRRDSLCTMTGRGFWGNRIPSWALFDS
jgi:hypothetical protein